MVYYLVLNNKHLKKKQIKTAKIEKKSSKECKLLRISWEWNASFAKILLEEVKPRKQRAKHQKLRIPSDERILKEMFYMD